MKVWVDVIWRFRQPAADWSLFSSFFASTLLDGGMPLSYTTSSRYHVPLTSVEKVCISNNIWGCIFIESIILMGYFT
jgi:hypothetical protein